MPGWAGLVILLGAFALALYRVSYSVRAARAQRAGNRDRAESLQLKGHLAFLGMAAGLTLLLVLGVAVAISFR